MNEQGSTRRRDWIKNAVIVFLIIMLILTFFSNTIMNYSLPEVSAEYVSSSTITTRVREPVRSHPATSGGSTRRRA
ncbi:MAG: hypothetical protein LUC90_07700 [Lachnospiraceae bacterium]|nr:hypothetical protein [Lachnospiraceae bacterium]